MYVTMTVNDVRRLLVVASSFETKYDNRMATLCEVAFTLTFWTVVVLAWLI